MDEMKEEMEKILRTLKEKEVDFEEYHHEALDNVLQREEKDLCFDAKICKNLGPLGILHDRQGTVEVVFDESLRQASRVAMHPSVNTATVVLPFEQLEGLIRKNGNLIYFMNF